MKFNELLELVGQQPIFSTGFLISGNVDTGDLRRQLSRWEKAGKVEQLKRGLYRLAEPYVKVQAHPFLIANEMVRGSYISNQSALEYYSMIPEAVKMFTSISKRKTVLFRGKYKFSYLAAPYYFGFNQIEIVQDQFVFIASPEKALLDLIHLTPQGDSKQYLSELRLQNLGQLDFDLLQSYAERSNKPKWKRAVDALIDLFKTEMV